MRADVLQRLAALESEPAGGTETPATPAAAPSATADPGPRVALVVANAAYDEAPLQNPTVDADLLRPALERMGFTVTVVKDADFKAFVLALQSFYSDAKDADIALFYFAGHGFALDSPLGT